MLIFASSFLAMGPASAQAQPRIKIDTNGDGIVDFNEMQAMHPELTIAEFNKMDTNSDGQLVPDELAAAHMAKRMERIDTDGDGAISLEEMEAHRPPHADAAERFQQFDSNSDGKLSQEELKAMREEMRKHMPEFMKPRNGHPAEVEESDQ
jgi:Ca2+-binding EF-hand superfamily protein